MSDDVSNGRRHPSNDDSTPRQEFHPTVEQLSAYLDNDPDIEPAERDAITGHLAGCRECQAVVDDLQAVVMALGELPEVEAPRAFALTREMVEPATRPAPRQPVVMRESAQWHARHAAKIRWATAAAAILFVFTVSADLVLHGFQRSGSDMDGDMSAITMMADDAESGDEARMADEPVPTDSAAQEAAEEAEDEFAPMDAPQADSDEEPVLESDDAEQPESDEPATAADDAAGGQADDDSAEDLDGEIATLSFEEEEIAGEPASEVAEQSADSSQMRWRIAQVSLALVLALLLAVMIGLPKQRGQRRR